MSEEGGLEKKLKGYEQSVAIGQGVGLAATAGGVLNVDKLTRYVPGIENLRADLNLLSTYAVDARYPGLPISDEEAKECMVIMERVRASLRTYFKLGK